ncbi:MAG: Rad52/Rad22 family DNA repair protein [Gemmataceae bacterium]
MGATTNLHTNKPSTPEDITRALAAPFDPHLVKFKPAAVSGNRALALAYVDARVIQDRLDEVLGVEGWQDDYECLPDGSVVCRLRLRIGDEWVTKVDVGGPSEQPAGGDRMKAAFSDALKRAAVKFGIGRYLYRFPAQWVDYDPQRRQFRQPPKLPDGAHPRETAPAKPPRQSAVHLMPANGTELHRRLSAYDATLAAQGLCRPGALLEHVQRTGAQAGYAGDITSWTGPAIELAVETAKAFAKQQRQPSPERKDVA